MVDEYEISRLRMEDVQSWFSLVQLNSILAGTSYVVVDLNQFARLHPAVSFLNLVD